jgi:hypothetical protein
MLYDITLKLTARDINAFWSGLRGTRLMPKPGSPHRCSYKIECNVTAMCRNGSKRVTMPSLKSRKHT